MTFADSAAIEVPALAELRDQVRPPDEMTMIELDDGRRMFAPAGTSPAEVKRQLANKEEGIVIAVPTGKRLALHSSSSLAS